MQQILSIVAAATALTIPSTGAVLTTAPIAVATCDVRDIVSTATMAEFGPQVALGSLRIAFRNTDATPATQVAFDVTHAGERRIVTDRGRFSSGVLIEHEFDDFGGDAGYSRTPDACTIAAVTFADGRRWTAPAR